MRRAAVAAVSLLLASTALGAPPPTRQLYTSTSAVEGLLVDGDALWVATRGGLEQYHLPTKRRARLWTTEEGLPSNFVEGIEPHPDGDGLRVRLAGSVCRLARAAKGSWRVAGCQSVAVGPSRPAPSGDSWRGARVTARARWQGQTIVGTATAGVWLGETDLTPVAAICSNHIVAMARFGGRIWFGSFDEGLCSLDGAGWQRAPGPFRMINDLLVVRDALYVASSEGLFRSRDGETFARVAGIAEGVADLARDEAGRATLAVTNTTLWVIPDGSGKRPRAHFRPGGTRSLQAVAAADGVVWLASEDRGAMKLSGRRLSHVEIYDALAGLPSSWAIDVGIDAAGTAYVGTLRHGVVAIQGGVARGLADAHAWTLAVVPSQQGGVWVGTQDGLVRLAASDGVRERLSGPPHPSVHAIFEVDPHQLWVATEGGTLRIDR